MNITDPLTNSLDSTLSSISSILVLQFQFLIPIMVAWWLLTFIYRFLLSWISTIPDSELSTLLDDEKEKLKELNEIKNSIKEIKIKRQNIINNKLEDLQNTSDNHFWVMTEDLFLLRKSQSLYQNSVTLKKILDKRKKSNIKTLISYSNKT